MKNHKSSIRRILTGTTTIVSHIFVYLLAAWITPGVTITNWVTVFPFFILVSAIGGVIWAFVARYLTPVLILIVGLLSIIINGEILITASDLIPGLTINGWGSAIMMAIAITAFSEIISGLLVIDDDKVWNRNVIKKMVNRSTDVITTDKTGFIFIQIDGLSKPVLEHAMYAGYAPNLAKWFRSKEYQLTQWECDLSSQTGASQAGILLGNNHNMPAFRWYDKKLKKVLVSNHPEDAHLIEETQSTGNGLLKEGASISNVFSGDSPESLMTFSTVLDSKMNNAKGLKYAFADPYLITRIISLGTADICREIAASWRARKRKVIPRLKRGGAYPILRAGATIGLRELTARTMVAEMYSGVEVMYADFVGYDEVAHHSGIYANDALECLYRIDNMIGKLKETAEQAPRPYQFILLSDHGQSQGETFKQKYGLSLADAIKKYTDEELDIYNPEFPTEGWGNINGVITSYINRDTTTSRFVKRIMKSRMDDGSVNLDPDSKDTDLDKEAEIISLASGNLALISFTEFEGRATLEQIESKYPGLVTNLTKLPGIGFILVKSETQGSIILGSEGVYKIETNQIEGSDPLKTYCSHALHHIKRTDSFNNVPDLLINGSYDPDLKEGSAFEELIGFHGGLGGAQSEPFVLHPAQLQMPEEKIIGAENIYKLFKEWMK